MGRSAGAVPSGEKQGFTIPLKCTRCGAKLSRGEEHIECLQCNARWPVVRGIPRFFEAQDYYWGEVTREKAAALLADAREGSWEQSVQSHIESENLRDYYLDLQRASWLALLGLDSSAVALDIGCGYGAITHSLALSVGEVISIEAIPERIEFTQERLHQERISNVSLFQASATALPFFENSFDLIVANGILEWIGEWDLEGSPRAAQLKFLASLQRLLKKDGVLVIGIENRFGLPAFRGGSDHSGIPYTSLVPRWVATRMLRRSKGPHYRTVLNAKREYRTYTYSARGYRKLLAEAGFGGVSAYWARPGYNRPYHLVPLESRQLLSEHFEHLATTERPFGRSRFHIRVKSGLLRAGIGSWTLPEFLVVAAKDSRHKTQLDGWVREVLNKELSPEYAGVLGSQKLLFTQQTRSFTDRTVLHIRNQKGRRLPVLATVNARKARSLEDDVETEFKHLTQVHEKLSERSGLSVRVPKPLDFWKSEKSVRLLVSLTKGEQLSTTIFRPGYGKDPETVRRDFSRAVRANIELTQAIQDARGIPAVDPGWYELPQEITADAHFAKAVSDLRYFSDPSRFRGRSWAQHGDYWASNIFFQKGTGLVEVIDWCGLARGFPPLYDLLSLVLYSAVSDYSAGRGPNPSSETALQQTLSDVFIRIKGVGQILRELLLEACKELQVDSVLLPSLLVEFLLLRARYYRSRSARYADALHFRLLRYCIDRF